MSPLALISLSVLGIASVSACKLDDTPMALRFHTSQKQISTCVSTIILLLILHEHAWFGAARRVN